MKIRNGFVSNSSSSSFVVVLPDNFDTETLDYSNLELEELTEENIKEVLKELIKDGGLWQEENYEAFNCLTELLNDYIIDSFDVSSDCGQINILDNAKIKKILGL